MGKLRKDDKVTGYDKRARREGITNILIEALGQEHPITAQVKRCHDEQTKEGQRTRESYCKRRMFCDVCSAMRFRLLKGMFYLRYQRTLKPLYTVVAKPKQPLKHENDQNLAGAFEAQKHELFKYFDSFLGGMELTWTDQQPSIGTLWPHIHVVAQGYGERPKRTIGTRYPAKLECNKLPAKAQDIDAALWHHCKPFPISWFPEKEDGKNIVKLQNYSLSGQQKKDVNFIVDNMHYLTESAELDKLQFWGRYDINIYEARNKELCYILQSHALSRRMCKFDSIGKRAHFTRSACYYYLTLLKGHTESDARIKIGLSESEYRQFRRMKSDPEIKVNAFGVLEDMKKNGEIASWSIPESATDEERRVITVALKYIDSTSIQSVLGLGESKIERILRRYELSHRDTRAFLRNLGVISERQLEADGQNETSKSDG